MDSLKENFHHANLIISGEEILYEVFSFVESLGIKTHGNENFILEKKDKFLIDDARKVFETHLKKTPEGELQIFVLYFNFITTEAQNALLKMFEEPKERTHFFIISPSKSLFLETILSRVNLIEVKVKSEKREARSFINMNVGERMKFIADLVKKIKDEKAVKQEAIDLLSQLEVDIEREARSDPTSLKLRGAGKREESFNSLRSIVEARKYINLNGASVKMLLENVALNV